MSSRLPRSRPSRNRPRRIGAPMSREDMRWFTMREDAERRGRVLSAALVQLGARLDRDPNGYCIAQDGRIVARCPNLDAVEVWLREQAPVLAPVRPGRSSR